MDAVIIAGEIDPMGKINLDSDPQGSTKLTEELQIAQLLETAQNWHQDISADQANRFL